MNIADLYLWTEIRMLTLWRGRFPRLCSVKFFVAWLKLLRARFSTSDVRWKVQNKMGLQVCEQPRAFLCKSGWARHSGTQPLEGESAPCLKLQRGRQSNSVAFHLQGFMCVSALQQEIRTHRPVQTDRFRQRCRHTQSATSYNISISISTDKTNSFLKKTFFLEVAQKTRYLGLPYNSLQFPPSQVCCKRNLYPLMVEIYNNKK